MKNTVPIRERERRLDVLMGEVCSGKIRRDTLVNSAIEFHDKTAAMYYSNARKNMRSDLAYEVMHHNAQKDDLYILKKVRK